MIRPLRQTDTTPTAGDCFKTCVAMVLDQPPERMPNFCHTDDWWAKFQQWLGDNHGMFAVEVKLKDKGPVLMSMPPGVPVILTGPSPSGDWLHAVVGFTHEDGFEYLYDPNPVDKFLVEVTDVLFFVPLRPDLATRKSHAYHAPTAHAA